MIQKVHSTLMAAKWTPILNIPLPTCGKPIIRAYSCLLAGRCALIGVLTVAGWYGRGHYWRAIVVSRWHGIRYLVRERGCSRRSAVESGAGQECEATIRLREAGGHRRALLQMQEMAAKYDTISPAGAERAGERYSGSAPGLSGGGKIANGGAMSLGRTAP